MGSEVGWHLRFSKEDELTFVVQARLAPNVEDAVFMAGEWLLDWELPGEDAVSREHWSARVRRKTPRRGAG